MTVQMISALVLWTMVVSGTAPWDFRNFTSDRIIQPKTKMPIATHHQKMSHVQRVDLARERRDTPRHVHERPVRARRRSHGQKGSREGAQFFEFCGASINLEWTFVSDRPV